MLLELVRGTVQLWREVFEIHDIVWCGGCDDAAAVENEGGLCQLERYNLLLVENSSGIEHGHYGMLSRSS
jgi:hypothetical protein